MPRDARIHPALTGTLVAAVIAVVAIGAPPMAARLPEYFGGLPLSPIAVAILLGVALSGLARDRPTWDSGLRFATGPLLKLAVMLIGLRLSLGQLGSLGVQALPLVAAALLSGLGLAWLFGRLLGIGSRLTALLAVGSAVCGVSAIAALAPALKPRPEETAYALACVAVFGLFATLLYPWLFGTLLPDGRIVGLVLGAAIHDTAQVTAAALLFEQAAGHPEVVAAATVTKLLRNLSMLVVIPAVAWWALRGAPLAGTRPAFPWFILGFLALAAVRSAGDAVVPDSRAWQALLDVAALCSTFLFAMAIAAIGMGIRIASLKSLGLRPALLAVLTAAGMLAATLLVVTTLY
ncbi:MAG TPA: putative sulfate exporter family transporter [Gammaproteobacteria bacterium]|nr:putative sulfate exporter family transporter [Gammaproteobacteria bacterium]